MPVRVRSVSMRTEIQQDERSRSTAATWRYDDEDFSFDCRGPRSRPAVDGSIGSRDDPGPGAADAAGATDAAIAAGRAGRTPSDQPGPRAGAPARESIGVDAYS